MHICWSVLIRSIWETIASGALGVWRTIGLIIGAVVFILCELCLSLCLALDHILFPGFRKTAVTAPVFVIGNPRSGTTHLFRLLARDHQRFTYFTLLQILFPAVIQRAFFALLSRVDPYLGHPLRKMRQTIERDFLESMDKFHVARFHESEEDDFLTVHQFANGPLLLGPRPPDFALPPNYLSFWPSKTFLSLATFDTLPAGFRRRVSAFYQSCLQRHLYWEGKGRTFLSKNPTMCMRLQTVRERFPDARFIYILRNPTVSMASFATMISHGVSGPGERLPQQHAQWFFDTACEFYRHAFQELAQMPESARCFVEYEQLVAHPAETILEIYQHFGWQPTPEFLATLDEATAAARAYRSRNHYKLDLGTITESQIRTALPFIYEKYQFQEAVASELPAVNAGHASPEVTESANPTQAEPAASSAT